MTSRVTSWAVWFYPGAEEGEGEMSASLAEVVRLTTYTARQDSPLGWVILAIMVLVPLAVITTILVQWRRRRRRPPYGP